MTNYRFAFYTSTKKISLGVAERVALGARAHGDTVERVPQTKELNPADYDGAICLGMSMAVKHTWHKFREAGKFFVFMDKGYTNKGVYWRFAVNEWQPLAYFQRFARPPNRLKKMHIRLRPFRVPRPESSIVYAGACQAYNNLMDLGNINEHCIAAVQQIRAHSNRPIIYRPNPAWALSHASEVPPIEGTIWSPPSEPFSAVLPCWLLVSHGTSAALHAVMQGTPTMVLGGGIARPLSLTELDWERIEEPYYPADKDRFQLLCDMSYCQWTLQEYINGAAWEELRLVLACLSQKPDAISAPALIRQYELMHQSSKYFRGRSIIKEQDTIAGLVFAHKSDTLLDYGSGKGEQYQSPYYLDDVWGVSVTCYDPAVPEFARLPSGKFDGVVCTDVMEHVLEEQVQSTLQQVLRYARNFAFFSIATSPAKKNMPDGRNCHVTIQPPDWWEQQLKLAKKRAGFKGELSVVFTSDGNNE